MLGCGDDKFDVSKYCTETCATSSGKFTKYRIKVNNHKVFKFKVNNQHKK